MAGGDYSRAGMVASARAVGWTATWAQTTAESVLSMEEALNFSGI